MAIRWLYDPFCFPDNGVYAGGNYAHSVCVHGPGHWKHDSPGIAGHPVGLPIHDKGILASIDRKPGQVVRQNQGLQTPHGIER